MVTESREATNPNRSGPGARALDRLSRSLDAVAYLSDEPRRLGLSGLREALRRIPEDRDTTAVALVGRFARYATLFHPRLAGALCDLDEAALREATDADLRARAKEIGLDETLVAREIEKLRAVRASAGELPTEIEHVLGRQLDAEDRHLLRDREIFRLADARGIRSDPELEGRPWAATLFGLAQWSAVARHAEVGRTLLEAGVTSPRALAGWRTRDLSKLADRTGWSREALFTLRERAVDQTNAVDGSIEALAIARDHDGHLRRNDPRLKKLIDELFGVDWREPREPDCTACDDCASVLSRSAYLLDLVNLIARRVRILEGDTYQLLDVDRLEARLHRDLRGLETACDEEPVERAQICVEVLSRYAVANNEHVADLAALEGELENRRPDAYRRWSRAWRDGLAAAMGLTATELVTFLDALKAGASASDAQQAQLERIEANLALDGGTPAFAGFPAANSASQLRQGLTAIDAEAPNGAQLKDLARITESILLRQLYRRWALEDELMALAGTSSVPSDALADARRDAYEAHVRKTKRLIEAAANEALPHFVEALRDRQILGLSASQTVEALEAELFLSCGSGACERVTRLEEATDAVRLFFEGQLLAQTRGTDDGDEDTEGELAEWERYQTYETWRAARTRRIYPEMFLQHHPDVDRFPSEYVVMTSVAVGPNPSDGYVAAPRHHELPVRDVEDLINSVGPVDTTYVRSELANLHREVWKLLPPRWEEGGIPTDGEIEFTRARRRYEASMEQAADPTRILGLELCDWVFLQRETLRMMRGVRVPPTVSSTPDEVQEQQAEIRASANNYRLRTTGTEGGGAYQHAFIHELAFYVLPRMWGQLYERIEDHRRAALFYHLVYNENLERYPISRRTPQGAQEMTWIGPVVYEQLRKFNPHPSANPLNRYDVETKDMQLRIARNYVAWADLEFRRDTKETRALARELYGRVLRLFGHTEHGDTPSCEDPCRRMVRELETSVLDDLGLTRDEAPSKLWRSLERRVRKKEALAELVTATRRAATEGGRAAVIAMWQDRVDALPPSEKVGTVLDRAAKAEAAWVTTGAAYYAHHAFGRTEGYWPDPEGGSNPLDDPFFGFDDEPMVDVGDVWIPGENPPLLPALEAVCGSWEEWVPSIVTAQFCVPLNPMVRSLIARSCLGLRLIRECRNALGYRRTQVPVHRFDHLLETARYFANLALAAEKDFIAFQRQSDAAVLESQRALQALHVADATIDVHRALQRQAREHLDRSEVQRERVALQQEQVDEQIAEGPTDLEEQALEYMALSRDLQMTAGVLHGAAAGVQLAAVIPGMVVGASGGASLGATVGGAIGNAIGAGGGAVIGGIGFGVLGGLASGLPTAAGGLSAAGAAAGSFAGAAGTQAQILQLQNSIEERQRELRRTRALLEVDARIAVEEEDIARSGVEVSDAQLDVAQLNATFAADIVELLQARFFDGDRLAWMALIAKDHYRVLLGYAVTAAWLAERALEFERQQELRLIRFDYWRERDEGLMGVDQLITDLAGLEHERLVNEQRRHQVTKVFSLAHAAPIELERFRRTGTVAFDTLLESFERDFPTHYLRLIESVQVDVLALVPPTEGIKAMLTQLGTSRTTKRVDGGFEEVTLRREPERVAISSPLGAGNIATLSPSPTMLNPFEGNGVAGSWQLEMPRSSNPNVDYRAVFDLQLTLRYSALDDPSKPPRAPRAASGAVTLSVAVGFPDALFHLHNPNFEASVHGFESGQAWPPYVVRLELRQEDLPPNQLVRRPRRVRLLVDRGVSDEQPLTTLRHRPAGASAFAEVWGRRATDTAGLVSASAAEVSTLDLTDVDGTWELELEHDVDVWKQAMGLPTDLPTSSFDPTNHAVLGGPHDLFQWEVDANADRWVPRTTAGHAVLDLSWLVDLTLMIEYEYVGG